MVPILCLATWILATCNMSRSSVNRIHPWEVMVLSSRAEKGLCRAFLGDIHLKDSQSDIHCIHECLDALMIDPLRATHVCLSSVLYTPSTIVPHSRILLVESDVHWRAGVWT